MQVSPWLASRCGRRRRTIAAVIVGASIVVAACADGETASPSPPDRSTVETTVENVGVGDDAVPDDLDGLTGDLVLTRQRDLIDRGLINVLTHNGTDHPVVIHDRTLTASYFDSPPAKSRTARLGADRQRALQLPFGVVDDCVSDSPVTAVLEFTYATDTVSEFRRGRIDLGGTDILDRIRAERCTAIAFEAATTTSLDDVAMVDGTVTANLVITKTADDPKIAVGEPSGTILMSVRADDGSTGVSLEAAGERVVIPITFVVNRCDPHALAEVTKRYGLDLSISVDDAAPEAVAIDVADLTSDFEDVVQRCFDAAT